MKVRYFIGWIPALRFDHSTNEPESDRQVPMPCDRNRAALDSGESACEAFRNHSAGTEKVLATHWRASPAQVGPRRGFPGAAYGAVERAAQAGLPGKR